MPKQRQAQESVPESILLSSGEISIVMLDARYTPYSSHPAQIENLCGSFVETATSDGLEPVVMANRTCVSRQRELYHLHGNITISRGRASFMGAKGVAGIERLARSLRIGSPECIVHMAIFCVKLGKRAQVTSCGLLETNMARWGYFLRCEGRLYEETNAVRFSIHRFEGDFAFPEQFRPDGNDWTVTGKGTVLVRLTWRRLAWTREAERECLAFCDRVARWLHSCC